MKVAGIAFEDIVISFDADRFQVAAGADTPAPARCRCWSTARSTSGSRWRSWSISPRNFPRAALAGGCRGPRPCPHHFVRDACGLHGVAPRMPDEHARGRCKTRELSPTRRRPTSRASKRCGPIAARVSAMAGRSCSAHSAQPTPCMRRWWRVFTPTTSRSARRARYMEAMMALPAWAEWRAAALKETWMVPEDEADWPTVLRRAPRWALRRNA